MNKMALVRIIVFLLAWLNQYLVSKGYEALPVVSEEMVAELITFIVSVWTLSTHNHLKPKDKP